MTEDEIVGWHHQLNGREFEQALGDGKEQPGVLQSMGSQRVRHDWATEQQLPLLFQCPCWNTDFANFL